MTSRSRAPRRLAVFTAFVLLGVLTGVPAAQAHPTANFPARLQLPNGFQPEGITTGRGTTVFAGSLANGAIWRGNVRTGKGEVFIPGIAGRVAVGVDYERRANRLWVVGGPTGTVTAYNARTGAELKRYTIAGSGFLNDLVVTRKAVYVTDSFVQRLVVIPFGKHDALPAPADVRTLPLTGDIAFVANQFNANGIVAVNGGQTLILVQSVTHTLFRVNPRTGEAKAIALTGGALTDGDGLELRGHTLYVVRGVPNAVVVVRLGARLKTGRVLRTLTDPSLDVPSTGTLAADHLYVVNARFGTPPGPTTEYWITRLSRR